MKSETRLRLDTLHTRLKRNDITALEAANMLSDIVDEHRRPHVAKHIKFETDEAIIG